MVVVKAAISGMASAVSGPALTPTPTGHRSYRYAEKSLEQALVLKSVRMESALQGAAVLVDARLVLDAGATFRILDELSSDLMFLAGPSRFGNREPKHDEYLAEFFQEEFDHPDPMQSSQTRRRVSRRDVRAYIARTYSEMAGAPVSTMSAVYETIDSAMSGYVHGAAVHILDVYDSTGFNVPMPAVVGPQAAIERQFPGYLFRSLGSLAFAASALSLPEVAGTLVTAAGQLSNVDG